MKKKKRNKFKKILIVVILLIIVIILSLLNFGVLDDKINKYKLGKLNYSKETIDFFDKKDLTIPIIKYNKYSKTLEVAISSNNYIDRYFNNYLNIIYVDDEDFIVNINKLMDMGYSFSDVNKIYEKLEKKYIQLVTSSEYIGDIQKYLDLSYFVNDNLERYITYHKKMKDLGYEDVVTYVNIGLDKDYYTDVNDISNPDDLLVLCNKYNKLSSSYVPNDLVKVDSNYSTKSNTLKKEVYEAFLKLADAAKLDNLKLLVGSGYRSYQYQSGLYNSYVARDGVIEADTYSARAGYSEHQTGLAIDVADGDKKYLDEDSAEYEWLVNNAYKYGFIIRYTKNKEAVTGYQFEPWHIRYVGVNVATYINSNNLTFDEYMARIK